MNILSNAYMTIFSSKPENMAEWQMAQKLMENFDVQKLGEELAKEVIFEIVNHTSFPNNEITKEIVQRAESFAVELFSELKTNEPHMAEIERLERGNKLK
jgi:hypothetical protein